MKRTLTNSILMLAIAVLITSVAGAATDTTFIAYPY